ncbi:MAG: hypothetical protein WCQ96_05425 [Patescibacteria group bacterium]
MTAFRKQKRYREVQMDYKDPHEDDKRWALLQEKEAFRTDKVKVGLKNEPEPTS